MKPTTHFWNLALVAVLVALGWNNLRPQTQAAGSTTTSAEVTCDSSRSIQ